MIFNRLKVVKALSLAACLAAAPVLYAQSGEGSGSIPDNPGAENEPITQPISGTLPVVYVNTEGGAPIVSKEDYLNATLWIDPMGTEGVEALGSAAEPITLQIRGRGNSSWQMRKKPYKLKFSKKQKPFGFPKSKHFALIAHAGTQTYMQGETAYEMARVIGLGWVPRSYPVEVVLNGVNVGVYAFSETVRIDEGRLEINEQPENNTDPATIDDGWLVEIDNTVDTPQIVVYQNYLGEQKHPRLFTVKTPEVLSDEQLQWVTAQMTDATHAIYNPDKLSADWKECFDLTSLARYYIVQEASCNYDAFYGSTYMYHTAGGKWTFGPIWDSEATWEPDVRKGTFWDERNLYHGGSFGSSDGLYLPTWIAELWKYNEFRRIVLEEWEKFYPAYLDNVRAFVDRFYAQARAAYEVNGKIWPSYNSINIDWAYSRVTSHLSEYAAWFDQFIREAVGGVEGLAADTEAYPADVYTATGILVRRAATADEVAALPAGLYIVGGRKLIIR